MIIWLHMDQIRTPDHLYTDDPFQVVVVGYDDHGEIFAEDGEPAELAREWLDWSRLDEKLRDARDEHIAKTYGSERRMRWAEGMVRATK